jgi:hypothetical protein
MLHHIPLRCNTLQHTATHRNTLQHTATRCNTLQENHDTTPYASTLQHTATHCNTLQHTATRCSTPQQLNYTTLMPLRHPSAKNTWTKLTACCNIDRMDKRMYSLSHLRREKFLQLCSLLNCPAVCCSALVLTPLS